MPARYLYYFFFADWAAELLAIALHWNNLQLVTKPLLIILLAAWFMASSKNLMPLRYYTAAAFFFSWCGDVFLLVPSTAADWFMAGLASFLVAHILYILFFVRVIRRQHAPFCWNYKAIILVTAYTVLLLFFLFPFVGNLKIPVTLYAVAIAAMLLAAVHAANKNNKKAGWYCTAGAVLFLCSDSLLALNKFYRPLPAANLLVMFSYGLAQFGIAKGSLLYLAAEKTASFQQAAGTTQEV